MQITVERIKSTAEATLSFWRVDGETVCFGLEDQRQAAKVPGETRIPAGTYKARVKAFGGFHERYRRRFPAFHQGMIEVAGVPGFSDILIHIGNTDDDTAGCLLCGLTADMDRMQILESRTAYERLYRRVIAAALRGELTVEIVDRD